MFWTEVSLNFNLYFYYYAQTVFVGRVKLLLKRPDSEYKEGNLVGVEKEFQSLLNFDLDDSRVTTNLP